MANPLDLSKFKKVKSEKDHTILKHPHGHEIRVLHAPLSPKVKEKLDAFPMAEGGEIGEDRALKADQRTAGFNEARSRGSKIVGKQIHEYAEGGDVNNPKLQQAHKSNPEPKEQQSAQMASQIDPAKALSIQNSFRSMGAHKYAEGGPALDSNKVASAQDSMRKAFHFADGGIPVEQPPMSSVNDDPVHAQLVEAVNNLTQKYAPQSQVPLEDKAAPVGSSVPQAPDSSAVASPEVSSPMPMPQDMPPQGTLPEQAVQNVEQANRAESQAAHNIQGAEAEKAGIFEQQAARAQDMQQRYEEAGNNLHQQFEQVAQQVQQAKVDPNHWWDSKSTGSKVLTAIGMLFAGAGGGVAGHPEIASKAIDEAIERDISAQKENINNKNTLLSKYMEMYRSLPEAEQAARLTMNAGVEGLINQQAAKLGSQNAMNAAQLANANRRQSVLPQMEGLARGQVMGQMFNQMAAPQVPASNAEQGYQDKMQNMRILNPDLGKDMEAKYLPGVGIARVPVPDKLREELAMRKDLSDKLSQLENYSRENSGSLDPTVIKRGKAMAAQVQDAYRTAHQQGVFKESEKNFLESVLKADPTVFFSKVRALPGYQEARKFNDQTVKQYYKSYGIKPFASQQESGETAIMNGIQYRKVPGGWERAQ